MALVRGKWTVAWKCWSNPSSSGKWQASTMKDLLGKFALEGEALPVPTGSACPQSSGSTCSMRSSRTGWCRRGSWAARRRGRSRPSSGRPAWARAFESPCRRVRRRWSPARSPIHWWRHNRERLVQQSYSFKSLWLRTVSPISIMRFRQRLMVLPIPNDSLLGIALIKNILLMPNMSHFSPTEAP